MKDILETILVYKTLEIQRQKEAVALNRLERLIDTLTHSPVSMSHKLQTSPTGIIAEFKRRSPSKGFIHEQADPTAIVPQYEAAGAAASSILTDNTFFAGSLYDVQQTRSLVSLPILRKDFIIDEYQLYQARLIGADAVLLIAAALTKEQCTRLTRIAHSLSLEVLLELHDESEIDYITDMTDMIGINNRHLGSFYTDVQQSFNLVKKLPQDRILISESGLSQPETIIALRETGFQGFLIGENFMKTSTPGKTLHHFIQAIS